MFNEWENEPNEKEFESHGYKCVVKRMPHMGHLCGYVHIPKAHPLWGKGYNELYDMDIDIDIHGGLTFAEQEGDEWVFGFDCAHHNDLVPSMAKHEANFYLGGVYRNMNYVTNETISLARQLAALGAK